MKTLFIEHPTLGLETFLKTTFHFRDISFAVFSESGLTDSQVSCNYAGCFCRESVRGIFWNGEGSSGTSLWNLFSLCAGRMPWVWFAAWFMPSLALWGRTDGGTADKGHAFSQATWMFHGRFAPERGHGWLLPSPEGGKWVDGSRPFARRLWDSCKLHGVISRFQNRIW